MASRGSKGKTVDMSTEWSEYEWDQRGFWVSSRLNVYGERDYSYRYPERAQSSSQDQQAIPRSLGPNDTTEPSLSAISNETNGPEQGTRYTTLNPSYYSYPSSTGYNVSTTSYTGYNASGAPYAGGASQAKLDSTYQSDTESVATVRSPSSSYAGTASSYTPQTYQIETTASSMTQSLSRMAIAGPSTSLEQATFPPPREEKIIRNIPPGGDRSEQLDPRYKVVDERKQKKFWKVGRVFMVLWTEPARHVGRDVEGGPSTTGSKFSKTYLEGTAFTEIRRFVVVVVGHGNCICSPIHTYGGKATLKPNLPERQQHAIIYTSDRPPDECWYTADDGTIVEENLTKDPIKVRREQTGPEGDLGAISRINYSKIYTVENYVRVLNIGMVEDGSIPALEYNSFVKPRQSPVEGPRNHTRRTNSYTDDNKSKGKGKEKDSGRRRR